MLIVENKTLYKHIDLYKLSSDVSDKYCLLVFILLFFFFFFKFRDKEIMSTNIKINLCFEIFDEIFSQGKFYAFRIMIP